MAHSCVQNYLHIIFATKDRSSLIPMEIETRLHQYMCGISRESKSPVLQINGTDNHIHILLNLHPAIALSTLVKEVKSYSTSWIKKEGFGSFSWQEGYGGFSSSKSHVEQIRRYIENQKEHHKLKSFDDEIELLNRQWGTTWMQE